MNIVLLIGLAMFAAVFVVCVAMITWLVARMVYEDRDLPAFGLLFFVVAIILVVVGVFYEGWMAR